LSALSNIISAVTEKPKQWPPSLMSLLVAFIHA
jgi:hypothetical protein